MLFKEIITADSVNNMKYINKFCEKNVEYRVRWNKKRINSVKCNVLYFIQNLPSMQNCVITLYCRKVNKIRNEIWPKSRKTALHNLVFVGPVAQSV